ncbi:unnamed protein product [Blumeria hordei]|uniref:Uncharacterized protein n=1 Tax=Blumeria hordei TaxID=2867405 RepID=A0A383UI27_BLUHO|nr:unnamed protein product [Blumeria hordei]
MGQTTNPFNHDNKLSTVVWVTTQGSVEDGNTILFRIIMINLERISCLLEKSGLNIIYYIIIYK